MQTAINPALAAAMTLERAAQVGEFQPTTREGQPTVAAQLMQKATPPAVPEIAQQAGLAGQIQAMKMQEAQRALMQQAMSQRPPAGIEGLNPQMGGFAEGGIVGYANGDVVSDPGGLGVSETAGAGTEGGVTREELLDKILRGVMVWPSRASDALLAPINLIRNLTTHGGVSMSPFMDVIRRQEAEAQQRAEARKNAVDQKEADTAGPAAAPVAPPPAPGGGIQTLPQAQKAAPAPRPTAGLASSSEKDLNDMMSLAKELSQLPKSADPSKTGDLAMAEKQAADDFARRTGNDPDLVLKQIQQYEDLYRRRDEQLARRMEQLEAGKQFGGIKEFLLGARGIKGQGGIGAELGSGARAAMAYDESVRNRMEQIEDLRMDLENTKTERVNNLRKMKYETDMGNFAAARQRQQRELDLGRQEKALQVELAGKIADIRSHEARVRAQVESSAADRAAMRQTGIDQKMADQLRQNIANYNKAADDIKDRYKNALAPFQAMSVTGKPLPPDQQKAYNDLIAQRDQEIAMQTADIRKEIDRLQTQIYGAGAIKQAAPTVEAGAVREYQGTKYRFKGGNQYDRANWEKV